jgi:hypothetical protein
MLGARFGPSFQNIVVKAVDADKNTITFEEERMPDAVAGKTFTVAKDASIAVDGKPGKLAGIPMGAFVNLNLSVDLKAARNLGAEGAQIGAFGGNAAVVQAVDADKNTITVDINGEGEKTFPVAKDAYIQINNRQGNLAGVPREASVTLTLSVDQRTVCRIQAKAP